MSFLNKSTTIEQIESIKKQYTTASPFPHIIVDNFLEESIANNILSEFPSVDSNEWINYLHVNENKYGKNDIKSFGNNIKGLLEELSSPSFINFLSDITGIEGLLPDPSYEGGGLHQSKAGGYLNIHSDFTAHPHNNKWRRRLNLLVYFNKEWKEEYNGQLELWDRGMKNCEVKIPPTFNKAVLFNTNETSWHGHPKPLQCPEDMTRKSVALYYFTEEEKVKIRCTTYKGTPDDSFKKKLFIKLDNLALKIYDTLKRILNFDDDFASKILKMLSGK